MPTFKDHFSKQSDLYVKHRPHYPSELYQYLASLTPAHELAWDCGTGNGQAAVALAGFYNEVIASDPSQQQIKNAQPHQKVIYLVQKAEHSGVLSNSIDLLTIANALHWFDFDKFYMEARRVLKPNGIIAAWGYLLPSASPEIDAIIEHYHYKTLDDYWLPENRLIEKAYQTIPFPFTPIEAPKFTIEKNMNLHELIGYLNTWSATQRFIAQNHSNPADALYDAFLPLWKDPDLEKKFKWELVLKVGINN